MRPFSYISVEKQTLFGLGFQKKIGNRALILNELFRIKNRFVECDLDCDCREHLLTIVYAK